MFIDKSQFVSFTRDQTTKASFVYLDIKVGANKPKRVIIRLFYDDMPKTCENFRALCTGERSTPQHRLHYKESTFTKIYTDFMAQGGDIVKKDGTGSICIYGQHFKPEPIKHKHNERGLISMFNQGDGKLGCQFFFTFGDCTWVDGIHSVFGHIVDDMSILDDLEQVSNSNGVPKKLVRIVDCGQLM